MSQDDSRRMRFSLAPIVPCEPGDHQDQRRHGEEIASSFKHGSSSSKPTHGEHAPQASTNAPPTEPRSWDTQRCGRCASRIPNRSARPLQSEMREASYQLPKAE